MKEDQCLNKRIVFGDVVKNKHDNNRGIVFYLDNSKNKVVVITDNWPYPREWNADDLIVIENNKDKRRMSDNHFVWKHSYFYEPK